MIHSSRVAQPPHPTRAQPNAPLVPDSAAKLEKGWANDGLFSLLTLRALEGRPGRFLDSGLGEMGASPVDRPVLRCSFEF